jgi:hypothetical protein
MSPDHEAEALRTAIGPGRLAQAWLAIVGALWCALGLFVTTVAATSRPLAALAPAALLFLGGTFFYRLVRLSVRLGEREMVARNYLKTWRLPAAEIAGFRVGSPSLGGTGTAAVVADLRDGRHVGLDATTRMRPRGTRGVEEMARALEVWLEKTAT